MNQINIFDILPESFFSILSSPYQEKYADCLFMMFFYMNTRNSFGASKENIINLLAEYLKDYPLDCEGTPHKQALSVLRRLKQCGWIFEEEHANYEIAVNFTYYAIPILKTLSELKKQDLEYNGYLYVIYTLLNNMEEDSLSDIIDQIAYNTMTLINRLKTLNGNIKKYLQDLINKKELNDLKAIVENLFNDYKKNVVDDYYHRLKTLDNISKYRPYIISKLNALILDEETINRVSLRLIERKKFTDISDAKKHLYDQLNFVIDSFTDVEDIIKEIDRKNMRYIQTSISKILFIVNNTQDIQGKINKIIYHLVHKNKQIKDELFRLYPVKVLETQSLYTMPQRMSEPELQLIDIEKQLTDMERQIALQSFLENNRYSKKHIEEYVKNLLKNNNVVKASKLPLNNDDDYIKLVLIYLYSGSDVCFKVQRLDNVCQNQGYVFYDFLIRGINNERTG